MTLQMEQLGTSPVKELTSSNPKPIKMIVLILVIALLGLGTGYGAYNVANAGKVMVGGNKVEVVKTANEEGVKDAATFRDSAEGTVVENDGKLTSEGTHILTREGGASQNVYLTSSVIDLSKYSGKKVQVWGETFKGQSAGWLMDVGRIKVQE